MRIQLISSSSETLNMERNELLQQHVFDDYMSIKQELKNANELVYSLEIKMIHKQSELQQICTHDYIEHDDGDYHRKTYFYVCSRCNHSTNARPKTYTKH